MPKRFELVVFDWDGTLMDSAAAIAEAIQEACRDLGQPVPDDERARYVIGLGLNDALAHVAPGLDVADYPRMIDRYRVHFLRRDGGTKLFDGARELLDELRDEGYLLGVATGKSRRGLDRAMADSGLAGFFDMTRCADEGHSKPHPGMLQAIIDGLATTPEQTLMIGDTTHDVQMAQAAGASALALTHGAHGREALQSSAPLALLDDLPALRLWLRAAA
ncbi:MAG: HAD-IA family hydrolase [Burkholderiales bacterium]|nr:HAD-IA family hydrolase [Burkholderiales bacterium]